VRRPGGERLLLYLDQNNLSGIVKRKPAFRELEPVLRAAVADGVVAVPELETHRLESAARPDLPLLELLRELSGGLVLDAAPADRRLERRLHALLERTFPDRPPRASDVVDLRALAAVLPRCRLVTCDSFMADVVRRTALDVRYHCELYSGRRADVDRLRRRLEALVSR
jgi:predicted nucleic acid-binding protein